MNAYRKALEIKPDYLPAHSAIIRMLLAEGKLDEAGKQIEVMKQIAPNHPQTHYLRPCWPIRRRTMRRPGTPSSCMLKAVPESPLGLQLAGLIEYDSQAYPAGRGLPAQGAAADAGLSIARRVLIASYLRNAQPSKALGILEPVLDKIDKDSNMLALAGQVFLQNGQVDKAGTYFAKATALDPKNPAKRTSLAMVNMAKGDSDVAFRDLEQVAAADTGSRADLALIAAHLQRREFDQALKAIAALEKKQPDNPLTHNLRGTALLGKRDAAAARKSFEKALALNPAYFPAAANLANLDLNEKKPEDARKRFESVLAKDPKNVQAFMALAQLRAKAGGTTEEVATLIGKAVTANPTDPHRVWR
jgi:putative PEP-CTERM system TPR-repeat lipoprotein